MRKRSRNCFLHFPWSCDVRKILKHLHFYWNMSMNSNLLLKKKIRSNFYNGISKNEQVHRERRRGHCPGVRQFLEARPGFEILTFYQVDIT